MESASRSPQALGWSYSRLATGNPDFMQESAHSQVSSPISSRCGLNAGWVLSGASESSTSEIENLAVECARSGEPLPMQSRYEATIAPRTPSSIAERRPLTTRKKTTDGHCSKVSSHRLTCIFPIIVESNLHFSSLLRAVVKRIAS